MKFGHVDSRTAAGGILAHPLRVGTEKWRKGRLLSPADSEALQAAGIDFVVVAVPAVDELPEDDAANRVAAAFCGGNIRLAKAVGGRVNVFATAAGLLEYAAEDVHRLNAVSDAVTVATLPPSSVVANGDLLATFKIIPFAVPEAAVRACETPLPFAVRPFVRRRVGLIETFFPESPVGDKTRRVTDDRLAAFAAAVVASAQVAHAKDAVAAALTAMRADAAPQLFLLAGASATSDGRDVLPAAVTAAGGEILRIGMPVDPGNLLFLGRLDGVPVVGLPGCAKSPKLNGFDWVLRRLVADSPLTAADIARFGVGGLLAEIPLRPAPRRQQQEERTPPVAVILLAAGAGRRMGGANKLLTLWRGQPLLTHAAATLSAALAEGIVQQGVAVVGRDADKTAALVTEADSGIEVVHNPDYANGMASSLQCGLAAVGDAPAALVMLADMPTVTVADVRAVVEFFRTTGEGIVVPTYRGKRGNPVLVARRYFSRLRTLSGDAGARVLFSDSTPATVEAATAGVVFDLDSPAQFENNGSGDDDADAGHVGA